LQKDPHELNNLADNPEYAGKRKEMMSRLAKAQEKYGDDCPLTVANPKPAAWSPPGSKPAKSAGKSGE